MENPRKLDGRYTTVNDRLQRMRYLYTNRTPTPTDRNGFIISDRGLAPDINRLRQRKSAKYALEWLESIRPDFRLESSEMEKFTEHQNYFPKLEPLHESQSKLEVQNCSAKNYNKYRENLRDSRKTRNKINDSFLRYWNTSQDMEMGNLPSESRHLVSAKNGKIFRYKQERIELLSMNGMIAPERNVSDDQQKKNDMELCSHPLLQPFLREQTDSQKAIAVGEMSGEAVVIYSRKGHRQLEDWKNYQIEQFAFGKTKFGLKLDPKNKRSSSETREKSQLKQMCVTRRRRSKFHYEPVNLGRSVSIEFKKFDEIQEMFHPDESAHCKNDDGYFWESNEFRLRSSAEMKLNLFKEMKKKERYRKKKFEETVARSLNYRLSENSSPRSLSGDEGKVNEVVVPEEKPPVDLSNESPPKADDNLEECMDAETLDVPVENPEECDAKSSSQEALKHLALTKLREILEELVADEITRNNKFKCEDQQKGDSDIFINEIFDLATNVSETGELESLMFQLQNTLKDCSHLFRPQTTKVEEPVKPKECFSFERQFVVQAMPVLMYPNRSLQRNVEDDDSEMGSSQKSRVSFSHIPLLERAKKSEGKRQLLDSSQMLLAPALEAGDEREQDYQAGGFALPEKKKLKKPGGSESGSLRSKSSLKGVKPPGSPRSTPCDSARAYKTTKVFERRVVRLENKLKRMLRKIGLCPTREQEAIKGCLERLKDTSEAVLRRLTRIEYCSEVGRDHYLTASSANSRRTPSQNSLRRSRSPMNVAKNASNSSFRGNPSNKRGYSSEPETAVKIDRKQKSIILKTSESEIQLKVGMEITMENFDPVTGQKLNPETNKDYEQQGNILCKLMKPGGKPVTFINTDFLYNPKTGEYPFFTYE
ncbi:UNVERIFIED_CONTAM: hypothetical protein PYX00_002678 [Menopon gallinae]|uniref:Uncharacterized protein n=1 Tax=Menopon gallinae TaxID=328185 RepID=A0AAW2HYS5_9NEOP